MAAVLTTNTIKVIITTKKAAKEVKRNTRK